METEIWKQVVGFEGLYEVSTQGRIKRVAKEVKTKAGYVIFVPERLLSLNTLDKDGYVKTALRKDGKRHYFRVHRVVAKAFLNNPNSYPVVNHKNGIIHDNRAENLEWCTVSYNTKHAFEILGREGQNGGTNKPVWMIDKNTGEKIRRFDSLTAASVYFGVSKSAIYQALKSNDRTSSGYKWIYCNEGVTTIENRIGYETLYEVSRVQRILSPLEAQREVTNL